MTSSKEILLLRRTLLNPVASLQFQHFVALKGELLENDVLFWLEVQRYKVSNVPRCEYSCAPVVQIMCLSGVGGPGSGTG